MDKRLRVGIVGADAKGQGWAPLSHFPALRTLPEFEIAALCTAHEEMAALARANNVPAVVGLQAPDLEHALRRHRLIDAIAQSGGASG